MENKIVLQVKDRNITVNTGQSNRAEVLREKQGTLTMMSVVPDTQAIIDNHNRDPHAHPNLWYVHEQGTASEVWEVQHNLDREPSVTVVDTANNVVIGYVTYINKNAVKITFNASFKGKAYLN